MGNWLSRVRRPLAAAGLGALLVATGVSLVVPAASAKDEKPTLSPKVVDKLKASQEALQKSDLEAAERLAREALALSTKTYDKDMSLHYILQVVIKKPDFPAAADLLEQLNTLDTVSPEDKRKNTKNIAQIRYQQVLDGRKGLEGLSGADKTAAEAKLEAAYDRSLTAAKAWSDLGGGSDSYLLQTSVYQMRQDFKNALASLVKATEGRDATEKELGQENFFCYKLGDKAGRQAVMETLVQKFLKREYAVDLVQIYQEQNADPLAMLNLYRFLYEHDFMQRESEFVEYADKALDAGAPAEALKIFQSGIDKGYVKLISPTDRNSKTLAQAKTLAAEDKRTLASLDKEARAGKNGEADVKLGLVYLGNGENDKAVEAIERGLTAERVAKVKRPDEAQMDLGIAYARLGKKEEAGKAFATAQKDARMTHPATLWLQAL